MVDTLIGLALLRAGLDAARVGQSVDGRHAADAQLQRNHAAHAVVERRRPIRVAVRTAALELYTPEFSIPMPQVSVPLSLL